MHKFRNKKKYLFILVMAVLALVMSACNLSPAIATISNSGTSVQVPQSLFSTFITDYSTLLKKEVQILNNPSMKSLVNPSNVINLDGQNGVGCILPNSSNVLSNTTIQGSGTGTFNSTFISCSLTQLIDATFLTEKLAKLKISLTKSMISSEESNIESQFKSALGTSGVFSSLSPFFKKEIAEYVASQQRIFGAVQTVIGLYTPKQLMSKFSLELSNFCVNGFYVQNSTEANDVVSLINSGKSMSAFANQLGLSTGSGNPLQSVGCGSMVNESQLAYSVFQLPRIYKGEAFVLSSQSTTGTPEYIVASVTSIKPVKYTSKLNSNLKAIAPYIEQKQAQISLLNIEQTSKISVDPKYGSWVSTGGTSFGVCPVNAKAIPYAINQTALAPGNTGNFIPPPNC